MANIASFFKGITRAISHRDYRRDDDSNFHFYYSNIDYKFKKYDVKELVEAFYNCNPIGYAVINKIVNSHRELDFYESVDGEAKYDNHIDIDFNYALFNLVTTGTAIFNRITPVGFSEEDSVIKVLNTLLWEEELKVNGTIDSYYDGIKITDLDNYVFIKLYNPLNSYSNLGLSPLNACMMPLHALNEMYTADASLLKNKGADVMITNDSDTPISGYTTDEMDKEINRRVGGARKHGGVATSTAKLRSLNLGRTTKELALWDGYKFKLRDVCNALSVDSSHFNDPENKKFSNVKEAQKSLYNNCVLPYNKLIVENKELINLMRLKVYTDTSDIGALQEDQKLRAEKNKTITDCIIQLNTQVQNGIITSEIAENILINEWGFSDDESKKYIGEREASNEIEDSQIKEEQ